MSRIPLTPDEIAEAREMLAHLDGTPPHDQPSNTSRGDAYYARSIEEKFDRSLDEIRRQVKGYEPPTIERVSAPANTLAGGAVVVDDDSDTRRPVSRERAREIAQMRQTVEQFERDHPYVWGADRAESLAAMRAMITGHIDGVLVDGDMASVIRDSDGATWRVNVTVTLTKLES